MSDKRYIVNVISHSLKGKAIAKAGDIVFESQLNGNADELVAQNFILPYDESAVKEEEKEATTDDALDDMTIADLKVFAVDNGLEVDEKFTKKADILNAVKEQIADKVKK